ncbi:MAG: hypothetical protein DMG07_11020 [Acidobacteria bacterium]|nr:MAG: hypothetical protein DMG07_11020 [Acidobacteriota bacterium]
MRPEPTAKSPKQSLSFATAAWAAALAIFALSPSTAEDAIRVGTRRELFVDDYLIARVAAPAELRLHQPERREVALVTDKPWEGNACAYSTVFRDGDRIRMYYGADQYDLKAKDMRGHPSFLCYVESRDGVQWRRPELGLVSFQGSTRNNIVLGEDTVRIPGVDKLRVDHFAIFKDSNPDCRRGEEYKMTAVGNRALFALGSSDGLRWKPISNAPIITMGYFDSKNLAFWDPVNRIYRAYFRDFRNTTSGAQRSQQAKPDEGHRYVRDIMTASSTDFIHWSEPEWLRYPGSPDEELYTNQVAPYYRAPHILMGFPKRYQDRGWSEAMRLLPNREHREARSSVSPRYGTAVTDAVFMTSRDGLHFHRWGEAFIRPGPLSNNWVYGDNGPTWGMIETPSHVTTAPPEISLYAVENYWRGDSMNLRRFTIRIDGFVSVNAPLSGGELVTKPLVFEGSQLELNFSTSAAGSIRLEIQDADGRPVPGFTLGEIPEIFGDAMDYVVPLRAASRLGDLAGRPVRLRFVMRDADLYAIRFK